MKISFHTINDLDTILVREIFSKLHKSSQNHTDEYSHLIQISSKISHEYDPILQKRSEVLDITYLPLHGIPILKKYSQDILLGVSIINSVKMKKSLFKND